jgi:hypothetical protein
MGSGSKDSPSRTRFLNCEVDGRMRVERTIQRSKFETPKPKGTVTYGGIRPAIVQ